LEKLKRSPTRNSVAQLQRLARERADEQARYIPWQRLYDVRTQYIDWQEFYLWVRSILEVEERVPNWLGGILDERCPGFLEREKALTPTSTKEKPFALHLEDWIDEHIFGFAKNEGWFNAITYYAVRDPRYQRAEVCWSGCVARWKKKKPFRYPTLEEWKSMAAHCDDTIRLVPDERRARASSKLVAQDRLAEAVSQYIDWEAFAYWARPALECSSRLPAEVRNELGSRCPGFLGLNDGAHGQQCSASVQGWHQLMCWIADHFFQNAKAEGWFDAILIQVHSHPRAIRTMEYADHGDEVGGAHPPNPYPSFEDWRRDADAYVELAADSSLPASPA
jgi:hypothetical protein